MEFNSKMIPAYEGECFGLMNVYWRGRLPCQNVKWVLEDKEVFLKDSLEKQREEIWDLTKRLHPDSYDGNLLTLRDYDVSSESMVLHMNTIKFSRVLTLEKKGIQLYPYGTIGMQLIVLSPDKELILIGQRSQNSMYCPLFYSVPGGMIEVGDTKGSFQDACLREFHEEVELDICKNLQLVGMTSEIHGTVGCVFLLLGESEIQPEIGLTEKGNDEWEGCTLRWHSVRNLETFRYSNSLEGIMFVKENLL